MKIKVCGMRDRENLVEVASLNPDLVGFIFYAPSPRYVKEGDFYDANAREVFALGRPPYRVGVFVNASEEEVLEETARYQLDYVQLHGDESPGFCASIQGFVPVIKVFRVGQDFDFGVCEAYQDACEYFLFDAKGLRYGGNGTKFDWKILSGYQGPTPFFLSGGIGPDDVEAIASLDHPYLEGIDVNSGFESAPGLKNKDLLETFFRGLRARDERINAV